MPVGLPGWGGEGGLVRVGVGVMGTAGKSG